MKNNFKPGSESDGFRGIKWGMDIKMLSDMECTGKMSGPGPGFYIRKGDKLKIGEAELIKIVYSFWRDKFYGVDIDTEGYFNWHNLQEVVFKKFGQPKEHSIESAEYNLLVGERTNILMDFDKTSEKGHLLICYKEITDEKENYEKQKAVEQDF